MWPSLVKIQYTELKLLCGNLCGRPPAISNHIIRPFSRRAYKKQAKYGNNWSSTSTLTKKWKTAIKGLFLFFNFWLSVMLDKVSYSFTSISFLTKLCHWYYTKYIVCYCFKANKERVYLSNVYPLIYSSDVNQTENYNLSTIK